MKIWETKYLLHFYFTVNLFKILTGNLHSIRSLVVLPNGLLVSGSNDGLIKIWDTKTGNEIETLEGHTDLSNGQLAGGSLDKTIEIWNTNTGNEIKTLIGHEDYVLSLFILKNNDLVSSSRDGTIKMWYSSYLEES